MKARLLVVGIEGIAKGETYEVLEGETVVLGRSRQCDFSFRDCPGYKALPEKEAESNRDISTISRKHLRIRFADVEEVILEDLSANGTFLDGKRIEHAVIRDLNRTGHEIRLGRRETMRIESPDSETTSLPQVEAKEVDVDAPHHSGVFAPRSSGEKPPSATTARGGDGGTKNGGDAAEEDED